MNKKETLEKVTMGCVGIGVVLTSCYSIYTSQRKDPFPIEVSLTETFTGEVKLDLSWEAINDDIFKKPTIRINRKLQDFNDSDTFSKEIDDSANSITIQAGAESKKGAVPSQKTNLTAHISPIFNGYQKIKNFEHLGEQINFTHVIKHQLVSDINLDTVKYHLYSQDGTLLESVAPKAVVLKDGLLTHEVQLLSLPLSEEDIVFLSISYNIGETSYTHYVKDFDNEPFNQTGSYRFEPVFINGIFSLKRQTQSNVTFQDYSIHGESLHLKLSSANESGYQLISINPNSTAVPFIPYSSGANKGIELDKVPVGDYLIKVNNSLLHCDGRDDSFVTWHTVTRNNSNKQIELRGYSGLLVLSVNQIEQLPSNVYDIVIDAGHGGSDAGAVGGGLLEKNEALKVSKYMAEKFEAHGLKVKLTRVDDEIEAEKSISDYETKPFVNGGRVDTIYQSQAKFVISNHLNAFNGTNRGSEVYSSIFTDNQWASLIINELSGIGRDVNSFDNEFLVSNGSYKKYLSCNSLGGSCHSQLSDYMYMIRETGGVLTQPATLVLKNSNYSTSPKYGAESILMEYVYIDNAQEREYWDKNWELLADAVVVATLNYLGIE